MTENADTGTEETGEEKKDPAWYRQQIERTNAENKALRDTIRNQLFDGIEGLDRSKGMGKTMTDLYDGELNRSDFLAWAKEKFDFEPKGAGSSPDPNRQGINSLVTESQDRQDGAIEGGQSLDAPSLDDRIAEAEKEGNLALAVSLKTQKLYSK